jgi:predicted DNA-binding transcriptional regulator AlpA
LLDAKREALHLLAHCFAKETPDQPRSLREATVILPDQIRSMRETAAILGVSLRQLQRMISMGDGPVVIRLSERRVGVSDADREAWVDARRRIAA